MKPIDEIQLIKLSLMSKEITYDEAKKLAKPFIDIINNKSKEIAKKYNQKCRKVTFSGLMR